MYIDPKSAIAEIPALVIRDLMRKVGSGYNCLASSEFITHILKKDKETSQNIIEKLLKEGYIEVDAETLAEKIYYKTTLKGNSLALASATKPLTRKTAEKRVAEFLDRVVIVNASDYYLYKVTKVIVFGSYLSEKDRLNDVDIAVEILPKFGKDEQEERNDKRIKEVERNGQRFSGFIDQLFYPTKEVFKYLKNRSRAISLHCSSDGILKHVNQKVIYEEYNIE